jgi:hypothetical protein
MTDQSNRRGVSKATAREARIREAAQGKVTPLSPAEIQSLSALEVMRYAAVKAATEGRRGVAARIARKLAQYESVPIFPEAADDKQGG